MALSCQAPCFSLVDEGSRPGFLGISQSCSFTVVERFAGIADDQGLEAE